MPEHRDLFAANPVMLVWVKRELQKAIELNPNDWISYGHMGAVPLYAGNPDASLKWYGSVKFTLSAHIVSAKKNEI